MYCSSCGAAVAWGISYCNHCGSKLGNATDESLAKPSEWFPESLVWAIVTVFIVGLGSIIALMALMKKLLNFGEGPIIAFTLLSFLLMLVIEGVLIWLLWRQMKGYLDRAGFALEEVIERDPYPEVEYQSRRAYIFARKPPAGQHAAREI